MKGSRKNGRRRGALGPVFSLGLSVPRWLGRSWREIIQGLRARLKKEASAGQRGKESQRRLKSSALREKREKGRETRPSAQMPGPGQPSRTPVLMDTDEIRRRLNNEGNLPDRLGGGKNKAQGYRLVRGPGGDYSVVTDIAYGAGGPLPEPWPEPSPEYSANEEESTATAPLPPPLPPSPAPAGNLPPAAAPGAASAAPPPAAVVPADTEISEVDIAAGEIDEVDVREVEELAPVGQEPAEPVEEPEPPPVFIAAKPRVSMFYPPRPAVSPPVPPPPPVRDTPGVSAPKVPANQGGERVAASPFQPRYSPGDCLPPLDLLQPADAQSASLSPEELIDCGILIEEKLAEFRVKVTVQDAYAGPVITRYEVQPAVGVRGGQIVNLMKDLARALGVASIRVVETIPGKTCMGLELPNPRRQMIHLSEVLSSEIFQAHTSKLALVLGKDILGEPVVADLARAPHMLVAGTTGSGKSVGVNAMILSLLYRATPDEVRLVMIDPKMLELSIYDGIPHLLAPVVTDMKHAANALKWCVGEMERRYRLMSALRVRNLAGYNQKVREAGDTGELPAGFAALALDVQLPLTPLPYIVVVVDEFADLMMVAGKKIEELIARLAQKARAAGIHLILATQRPSVDVITGLIKANIPTRIAFQVSSKIDSRTILDQMGAECLLGQGDMLYLPPGTGYPQRVHGAFVADEEVQAVAEYLKQFGGPDYVEGVLGGTDDADEILGAERADEENDPLYDEAVEFVLSSRRASISAVQRQLRVGYNRAARIVEKMEAAGLVSPMESNGNRTVLIPEP